MWLRLAHERLDLAVLGAYAAGRVANPSRSDGWGGRMIDCPRRAAKPTGPPNGPKSGSKPAPANPDLLPKT